MKRLTVDETAALLLEQRVLTLVTHRRPDGDTVGSASALCRGLRALGKRASVLVNPQLTPRYAFCCEGLAAAEPEGFIVAVDVASVGQLPLNYSGHVDLCIDHHVSNAGYSDALCLDADAAACGEIVFSLLKALKVPFTKEIANALYTAISTDTGCFRYSNVTPSTLRAAAELMEAGADAAALVQVLFEKKTRARMELEAYVASRLQLYGGGRVAVCLLPDTVLRDLHATEDDADSISTLPRNLEGVALGAVLRDLPDGKTKISLRADASAANASAICGRLGGGGHPAAAGASVSADMEQTRLLLLEAIDAETGLISGKNV